MLMSIVGGLGYWIEMETKKKITKKTARNSLLEENPNFNDLPKREQMELIAERLYKLRNPSHTKFQEETIRGLLSKNDPNFLNLSEEEQKELITKEIERFKIIRLTAL